MNHAIKTSDGYTLIELLMTLCIMSILFSLALPSFASVIRHVQSETVMNAFFNAYQLARSTAVSQRQPVVLCAKANAQACGSDWTRGSLVFADPNNNRMLDKDERLLIELAAPPEGSRLTMRAALNKQYLRFMANGMLENTAGSMVYCPPNGTARDARNVIFSRNGRLRFGYDKNHDGMAENAEGQPLSCPS